MADLPGLSPEELAVALERPALAPPYSITPNLENPPNQNTLGACFVALISQDYSSLETVGFLVHQWDVRLRDMITYLHVSLQTSIYSHRSVRGAELKQDFLIFSTLQILSVGTLKVVVLSYWVRLFVPAGTRNSFFWACHIVMWINIIWTIVYPIAANLACVPHRATWDLTIRGKCFDKRALDIAAAAMALVTDLAILILPHRVIWRLHMSTQKKAGVSAIFCPGLFGCVAAAARLATAVILDTSSDTLYHYSALSLLANAEYTAGMLVLCGPSIPKAFDQIRNSGAFAALRSWMGFASRGSLQSLAHRGGHATNSNPRTYQQMDTPSGSIPLVRLNQTSSREQPRCHSLPEDGAVLLTTEFSTTEHRDSNFASDCHDRQHPWMEGQV
ncbi:hypothetical protein PG985_009853 [Apiospora marii]|uniref:Rhodopsin domain-containing protein n=1 Tax=Apiospora marii TaxID=335849 RepID=A0ABR1RQU4_9PEZI